LEENNEKKEKANDEEDVQNDQQGGSVEIYRDEIFRRLQTL
jgi:hypothetical protein